ncbi:serine hydrolase [Actinoplanes sp. NPDC048796]|uniref:serine hydrolase n=1 Tax=unclassified Actinoplanes TaxID=2626549 RepID=UPI0033C2ACCD
MSVREVVERVVAATPGVQWSISVPGLAEHAPDRKLRTASIGKLLLLLETAKRFDSGELDPHELLRKDPALAVADSGLWHLLAVDALPAADVAALVAAVSDNYATNVLLQRIGLDNVGQAAFQDTALLDFVRDKREPHHPPTLSTGSARELAALMRRVATGDTAVERRMRAWLGTNTDLSMVASAWHADPLWHPGEFGNKTGTDDGIRADVGFRGRQPYAVLTNWNPAQGDRTAEVLTAMREIGAALR